jgi:riboflavin kinase/FMN adenylyltransferase
MSTYIFDWTGKPPSQARGGAVTVGNFDGVHHGHTALVRELRPLARAVGGPAVVLTFDPHPLQLLRPEQFQPVLSTATDRAELLQAAGADHVLLLQTTPALLQLTAEEFFQQVIREQLDARALVEGENFGFGHNREGNIATLTSLCRQAGVPLVVVPPVLRGDRPVSSSRVRNALVGGAVREAADLLDRPYRLRGTVVSGQRRGRKIGFPTANLEQIETLVPGDGVYAVRVLSGAETWPGAANIGPNPTFGEHVRKVEVHLIGFQGELQGQVLAMDFLDRLRDTRRFADVTQLVEQLHRDIEQARRVAG